MHNLQYYLLDEVEYDVKNYTDRGGCYPLEPKAEADNTLQELHNSSCHRNAEFNIYNCLLFIQSISKSSKNTKYALKWILTLV